MVHGGKSSDRLGGPMNPVRTARAAATRMKVGQCRRVERSRRETSTRNRLQTPQGGRGDVARGLAVLLAASVAAPAVAGLGLPKLQRPKLLHAKDFLPDVHFRPPDFLREALLRQQNKNANKPTFAELSDLRGRSRMITIVTTACMPWMTGTAVNPLLRAVYLERRKEGHMVSLLVPWLPEEEQKIIHPNFIFKRQEDQEDWVRKWVYKNLGFWTNVRFLWYEGHYRVNYGSILPLGDVTESIPPGEGDVIVMEEPEHMTWFHKGQPWCDAFNFVVGVVHTNYWNYAINDHQVPHVARSICFR